MDILDAGVFVAKWEAHVPKNAQPVLWGPLQAKEMGLDGWEFQDGGETGFVYHNPGVALTMGRATSTLIVVKRLEKAFLTVYFGGYPADAAPAQRRNDMMRVTQVCEMFLTRLAKQPIQFELQGEMTLVDNVSGPETLDAVQQDRLSANAPPSPEPIDVTPKGGSQIWEV